MSRFARLIAALSVLALLLAACGSNEPDEVTLSDSIDTSEEPDDGSEPDGTDSTEPSQSGSSGEGGEESGSDESATDSTGDTDDQWVTVFLLRDANGRLWVESEERRLAEPTQAVATAAMQQLFTVTPTDPGLFSPPVDAGVEVLGVELEDGLLTVDVSDAIYDASVGAAGEGMFRMAFAFTGTQFGTVDAVDLRVEGDAIEDLWGHVDWSEPAARDAYAQAPIDVERPRYGETLPRGPVTVTGTSLTFESTVELALIDPDGEIVEETFTTAHQPAVDQRGPFEHTFETEATRSGTWTIRVIQPDPSDGEGYPPYTADIAFTVE